MKHHNTEKTGQNTITVLIFLKDSQGDGGDIFGTRSAIKIIIRLLIPCLRGFLNHVCGTISPRSTSAGSISTCVLKYCALDNLVSENSMQTSAQMYKISKIKLHEFHCIGYKSIIYLSWSQGHC